MEKSLSQQRREVYLKALGIATEGEFMEWRRSGRCPVIVRLSYSAPLVISPLLARDMRLPHLAVRLHLVLADLAVNLSVREYEEDIARLLECSVRHLQRMQAKLKVTGWIDVKRIGFGFPNVIFLNEKPNSTP